MTAVLLTGKQLCWVECCTFILTYQIFGFEWFSWSLGKVGNAFCFSLSEEPFQKVLANCSLCVAVVVHLLMGNVSHGGHF